MCLVCNIILHGRTYVKGPSVFVLPLSPEESLVFSVKKGIKKDRDWHCRTQRQAEGSSECVSGHARPVKALIYPDIWYNTPPPSVCVCVYSLPFFSFFDMYHTYFLESQGIRCHCILSGAYKHTYISSILYLKHIAQGFKVKTFSRLLLPSARLWTAFWVWLRSAICRQVHLPHPAAEIFFFFSLGQLCGRISKIPGSLWIKGLGILFKREAGLMIFFSVPWCQKKQAEEGAKKGKKKAKKRPKELIISSLILFFSFWCIYTYIFLNLFRLVHQCNLSVEMITLMAMRLSYLKKGWVYEPWRGHEIIQIAIFFIPMNVLHYSGNQEFF